MSELQLSRFARAVAHTLEVLLVSLCLQRKIVSVFVIVAILVSQFVIVAIHNVSKRAFRTCFTFI